MSRGRVLVAMSGGVDSSLSACLLSSRGFECSGVTMVLWNREPEGVGLAKQAATVCGCSHAVLNYSDEFAKKVVSRFAGLYEQGCTPNPCIYCNRFFKFGKLLDYAASEGFNYLATGHYAQVEYSSARNCFVLKRAADQLKDQTYFLYFLTQKQLSRVLFPLGDLTKQNVKKLGASFGLKSASASESQDICFVGNEGYVNFIKNFTKKTYACGNFVDEAGKVLGRHSGLVNYTIGQRRGLGVAFCERLYVKQIRPQTNEVVLAPQNRLLIKKIGLKNVSLIFLEAAAQNFVFATVKLRYSSREFKARVCFQNSNEAVVELEKPQISPAKGQAVVFYDGELVVGGGIVAECFC